LHAVADRLEQGVVGPLLPGVGVEAADGDMVDLGAEVGGDQLGDRLEAAREAVVGILRGALIGSRDRLQPGGGVQRLPGGVADVPVVALGGPVVQRLEGVDLVVAIVGEAAIGEEVEALDGADRGDDALPGPEELGDGVADVRRLEGAILAAAGVVEVAPDSAGRLRDVGAGRGPDVGRAEVGAVGVGVADPLHHRHVTGVVEALEGAEGGVEADQIVEGEHVALVDRDRRADLIVGGVAVGDDGVEGIVAAAELDDESARLLFGPVMQASFSAAITSTVRVRKVGAETPIARSRLPCCRKERRVKGMGHLRVKWSVVREALAVDSVCHMVVDG